MYAKAVIRAGVLGAFLFGCAPGAMTNAELYAAGKPLSYPVYKGNVSWEQMKDDTLNCQVEAAQRVPQNIQIGSRPSFQTPSFTTCNGIGNSVFCNTSGGNTIGGGTYSFDANAVLRNQAANQCLTRKGYRSVSIPPCPQGVLPGQLKGGGPAGNLPPPFGPNTCYIVKEGVDVLGNY